LNPSSKKLYGSKGTYPDFQIESFESKDQLFEYTSKDNYTFTDGVVGICYGFQMEIDETTGAYELELFFNDQQQMGGPNSIGIPNT